MEEKEGFIFYRSFYNSIRKVKDKVKRCDLYEAIFELGLNNIDIDLNDEVGDIILELIKPQIQANNKRYIDGKKGGRPKKNDSFENQKPVVYESENHRLENQKPNDNVNVNDNVNENNINTTTTTNTSNNSSNNKAEIKNLELIKFYEEHFGRTISRTEVEILEMWEDTELTRYAIKQAELARAFNIKYVQRILQSYKTKNIKTVAEAEEAEKKFQESKTTANIKNKFEKLEEEKQKFYEEQND